MDRAARQEEIARFQVDPLRIVEPTADGEEPIACTLGPQDVEARVDEWQAALAAVVAREPIDGGMRLSLPGGAPLGAIVELAQAEQACAQNDHCTLILSSGNTGVNVNAGKP